MPAAKKPKDRGSGAGAKQQEILQAVVIADSFNFRFLPITLEQPRALLPLANRPLIDYTMEFLMSSGVEDIIVLCRSHAGLVRRHIERFKTSRLFVQSKVEVNVIGLGENSSVSAGDCLRELERQQLVRSDFVLVSGDVVSNMNLKKAMDEHKARRAVSKSSVMTLVVKPASPVHPARSQEDDILLALEPKTGRLLSFHNVKKDRKIHIPFSLLSSRSRAHIRYDLLDCHISICSPEVPQLFTDNFDYSCRDDFIKGVLVHEEIMGHQIHTYALSGEYAARVSNLTSYDSISKDMIQRWTYPVAPETCVTEDVGRPLTYKRGHVYVGLQVDVARSSTLSEDVLIGSGSSVGEGSRLEACTIGNNCSIGKNVNINGAYVWDNVIIHDNCRIDQAVICAGATIKSGAQISKGCVVSYNVTIGAGVLLPDCCKVTKAEQSVRDQQADSFAFGDDARELGADNKASSFPADDEEDERILGENCDGTVFHECDEASEEAHLYPQWGEAVGTKFDDEVSECESEDVDEEMESDDEDSARFYDEVLESVQQGIKENIEPVNLILEINGSKFAYNMTLEEIPDILIRVVLEIPKKAQLESAGLKQHFAKSLKHLAPVLQNYIRPQFQTAALRTMESLCLRDSFTQAMFPFIVHTMYNLDVMEEESILSWSRTEPPSDDDLNKSVDRYTIRKLSESLIEWLQNAEEESDEDEEE